MNTPTGRASKYWASRKKNILVTNALAYFANLSVTKERKVRKKLTAEPETETVFNGAAKFLPPTETHSAQHSCSQEATGESDLPGF